MNRTAISVDFIGSTRFIGIIAEQTHWVGANLIGSMEIIKWC